MNLLYKLLNKIFHNSFKSGLVDLMTSLKQEGLIVGKNFKIQEQVIIDSAFPWLITIGDNVTLAPRVHILAHDGSTRKFAGYTKIGKVNIGNRVFVGSSTTILPGVSIGNNVVIGTGSVVTRDIPDNTVAAGNPARDLCSMDDFLLRKRKELEIYPCFGEEYLAGACDDALRAEIVEKIHNRYGYIK